MCDILQKYEKNTAFLRENGVFLTIIYSAVKFI